jgi:hypothetical protein
MELSNVPSAATAAAASTRCTWGLGTIGSHPPPPHVVHDEAAATGAT